MKIFFYMGRNSNNKSGVSWKTWKIGRQGRKVEVCWGPVELKKRKVVPIGTLQTKTYTFSSSDEAKHFESSRIRSKTTKGYERKPRRA